MQLAELMGKKRLIYVPQGAEPRIKVKRGEHAVRNNDTVVTALKLVSEGKGLGRLRYSLREYKTTPERLQLLLERNCRELRELRMLEEIYQFLKIGKGRVEVVGHDPFSGDSYVRSEGHLTGTLKNAKPAIGTRLDAKVVRIVNFEVHFDRI